MHTMVFGAGIIGTTTYGAGSGKALAHLMHGNAPELDFRYA